MTHTVRDSLKAAGFTLVRELPATGSIETLVAHQAGKRAPVVLRVYGDGVDAKRRMEAEAGFLGGIDARYVARPSAIRPDCCYTLVFDDVPVDPLVEPSLPGVGAFLEVAIGMTRALGVLHDARKLHLALSADCFVCDREASRVVLMDLGGACLPLLKRPMAAALYAAPEVSGAMRWAPDVRSDLYSLGGIFYELLSGAPPFQGLSGRELTYAHLARVPAGLHTVRPGLPPLVVRLVEKLLSKSPDERYATAARLCQVLEQCRAALGADAAGGLAAGGVPDALRVPRSLHGRGAEERLLARALQATRRGAMQVVMVSGRSGVGKTALVEQFLRHNPHAVCLQGKFDVSSAPVPYSAVSFAMNGGIHRFFSESRGVLDGRRRAQAEALAGNGAVISTLVPDLEMLLGPQRSPPTLGPVENQHRFNRTVCAFLRALASADRPLILFLDDLHLADRSSVELLIMFLTGLRDAPVLLLGAYRDDAVSLEHPVEALLCACRKPGISFLPVALEPLDHAAACELYEEMLDSPTACVGPLAEAACGITGGNALRLVELLKQLHDARRLARKEDGTWFWERVESDGVALGQPAVTVETLPVAARELLSVAACLGDRLDLGLLGEMRATSVEALEDILVPAMTKQLVVWTASEGQKRQLAFRHDRIREALRERLPAEERQRTCWKAATILHKRGRPAGADEVFRVARYYNEAKALQVALSGNGAAQQNLQAARVAHRATAYQAAIDFLEHARDWLEGGGRRDGWAQNDLLCMAIHKQMVESNYLAGRFDEADRVAQVAISRSKSPMDSADLYRMLTIMHTIQSDYAGALELGRKGLRALHIELPSGDYRAHLDKELEQARLCLGGRTIDGLIAMDECESPESRLAMRLLVDIAPAAWLCAPDLYAVIVAKSAALGLAEGVCDQSANIFATYGLVLATERNENKAGYAFGKLGMAFAERFDNDADRCKTACIFGAHINHWVASVNDSIPIFAKGWAVGARAGEIQWAGYISQWWVVNLFCAGAPIRDVLEKADSLLNYNIAAKHEVIVDTLDGCKLILQELASGDLDAGRCSRFDARDGVFVARCESHHSGLSLCNYHVFKSFLMLLRGHHEAALKALELAAHNAALSRGSFTLAEIPFFRALATLGLARATGRALTPPEAAALEADRLEMRRLADTAPANFLCRQLLLEAAIRDFAGEPVGHAYDLAIAAAQERELVQVEALATELAARSYLRHGITVVGRTLFQRAVDLYARWGGECKVALLRNEFPLWLSPAVAVPAADRLLSAADLETLLKASRILAGELDPGVVLEQGLKLAMEYAGASHGGLFVRAGDEWAPGAVARAEQGGVVMLDPKPAWGREDRPAKLLEYVARTRETLVYDDMDQAGRFADDKCLRRRGIRSALCMPLLFKDQVKALLFLENAYVPGAFRSDRMTPLQMLLVHMAAAMENAGLFERLRAGEERYKAIFNASYQFTGLLSPDGTLLEANQGALDFAGIALADVSGKPFWEARWWAGDEARVAQLRYAIGRAARGEFVRYEVVVQGGGSRVARLDFSIKPVWDDAGLVRLLVPEGRDITEMRDAEAQMRQRDAQLRTLVDNIPGAVYRCEIEPPWPIVFISEEIASITGWPAGDFISGKVLYGDLIVPEDAAYVARVVAEAVRDCIPYSMEYRVRHRDGTIRWISEQGRASYDESGQPTWLDGVNFDITARRRTEQDLERVQRDYQTLFREMLDGFALHEMIYDAQGQPADYRFLAVNPAFERLTGLRADTTVGKRVLEVLPGTEKYWIERYGQVAKTGTPVSFDSYSGELGKHFQVTAFRPAPDQFAVIFVDVTERKIAEIYREMGRELLMVFAAVDDRKAMIQRALDILKQRTGFDAVGIRLREGEDCPYFAHAGFSADFLRTEGSLLALDEQGQLMRNADGSARLECTCGLVLSGKVDGAGPLFTKGGSFWTNDARPLLDLAPDQDPRFRPRNICIHKGYVSFALIPIRKAGQTLGLIHLADRRKDCFSLDRIELLESIASSVGEAIVRREAEAERERLAEQLRQSEKMQSIGQLAGGIAHDFNNQLGGIMGFAEILAERVEEPTSKGYVGKILSAASHAAELTRQLLAFSRKGKHVSVPVDVHRTIAEVVGLLTRSIDKRTEVKRHLDAAPSTVLADPTQLQNAILNLGLNARDAMPEGGDLVITTCVETLGEAQPAEELQAGRYVKISVTDTGVGMSPETQRRLFEPFFTTKEPGKGTGLGLASSYGTVKAHGGTIRVVSEQGKGSTFSVYLPVHEAEVAKPAVAVVTPAGSARGQGRILMVDDEPVILEMSATMLRKHGYEVTACGDPREALEVYRKEWQSIDLVILDMVMPKMGGRELFVAMQAINPTIRAILASGYSLDGEAQAIVDLGVMTFLQKPFRKGTLAQKVAETLAKK